MIASTIKALIGLMILKYIIMMATGIYIPDPVVYGLIALHLMSNKPLMHKVEKNSREFMDGFSKSYNQ